MKLNDSVDIEHIKKIIHNRIIIKSDKDVCLRIKLIRENTLSARMSRYGNKYFSLVFHSNE